MGNSCSDICDSVLDIICRKCPNYKACQNYDDEANHDQMLQCIGNISMKKYPSSFEDCDGIAHTTTYCNHELRDKIIFGDEKIDWSDLKNYHKEFEINSKGIKKLADAGLIDITNDDYVENTPPNKFFLETALANPGIVVYGHCRAPTDPNSKSNSGIDFDSISGIAKKSNFADLIYSCRWANELDFDLEVCSITAWWD